MNNITKTNKLINSDNILVKHENLSECKVFFLLYRTHKELLKKLSKDHLFRRVTLEIKRYGELIKYSRNIKR